MRIAWSDATTTIEQLLAAARSRLTRLSPHEARAAICEGALLVDIRSDGQRDRDGVILGARFVPRNGLEWRLDRSPRTATPRSRDPTHTSS